MPEEKRGYNESKVIQLILCSVKRGMIYTEWSMEDERLLQQSDSVFGNLISLAAILVLFFLIRIVLLKKEEALSKIVRIKKPLTQKVKRTIL